MPKNVQIIPVCTIGEVHAGENVATLLLDALAAQGDSLVDGDVVVVTQKIVSKAEGRVVIVEAIEPSPFAHAIAAQGNKDAHHYEVVLRESRRIVRMDRGVLITETHHGLICANSGVDESNVDGGRAVTLLPVDPDASADAIRAAIREQTGADVAVIISDSFGRAWREGQINIAIGVSGMLPLTNYAGQEDTYGYMLKASNLAVADELASAAELVMGKTDAVPIAIVRGFDYQPGEGRAHMLLRAPEKDMFR